MNEHRLTDRLTTYWENLRKDGQIPEFAHFNASAVDDIWQQCVLFTVVPGQVGRTPNLNFYKVGDKLKSIYNSDILGRTFNPTQKHFQGAAIVRKIDTILSNPVPLEDNGQFISEANKVVKFRSCLLPFGREGVVTHVLAGLSWREF